MDKRKGGGVFSGGEGVSVFFLFVVLLFGWFSLVLMSFAFPWLFGNGFPWLVLEEEVSHPIRPSAASSAGQGQAPWEQAKSQPHHAVIWDPHPV